MVKGDSGQARGGGAEEKVAPSCSAPLTVGPIPDRNGLGCEKRYQGGQAEVPCMFCMGWFQAR